MAVNLSPVAGAAWQFFDANGKPLNGGLLNTYTAGTTTPQPTFTTSAGSVQNSNPIVLGADGRTPQEIWLTSGIAYKFVLTDSLLNLIGTYDNIMGINDVSTSLSQWIATNLTPTFVSPTQFTVPGDQTLILTVGRRVQLIETAGTVVGVITAVAFTTITTVTVQFETTNVVDSGLSAVSYSLLTSVADPIPRGISVGPEISVASATSTPIGGAGSSNVLVTGTTTITSFDTVIAGIIRYVRFNGILTLTNNGTSLILPGGANITTASGDVMIIRSEGAGNWRVISYTAKNAVVNNLTANSVISSGLVDLSASGAGQIKFPATQNPSADANTFDDYEKGTWTPQLLFGGASTGMTFTTQVGRYTKVGDVVNASARMILSAKGSSTGTCTLSGFPYATVNDTTAFGCGGYSPFFQTFAASVTGPVIMQCSQNATAHLVYCVLAGTPATFGNLTQGDFNNTTNLHMNASFFTAT